MLLKLIILIVLVQFSSFCNSKSESPYFVNEDTLSSADTDKAMDMLDSKYYSDDYNLVKTETGDQDYGIFGSTPIYRSTQTFFGFLDSKAKKCGADDELYEITNLLEIDADETLKNSSVKVTLESVRAKDYPGKSMHEVLFEFHASNQLEDSEESVSYSLLSEIQEGEHASIKGWPIFIGLNVGTEGVKFWVSVTNIKNKDDKKFHNLLTSEVGQNGITLLETAQPIIKPFTSLITGLSKLIANRNDNVRIHNIKMGLDFSDDVNALKLREGTITTIQVPHSRMNEWSWDDWCFNPSNSMIVNKSNVIESVPYNYISFRVKRINTN